MYKWVIFIQEKIEKNMSQSEEDKYLDKIVEIVTESLHPHRIWLFGSRAEGDQRKGSDYDIAFEGAKADFRELRKTKEKISDAIGIYSCDLVDMGKLNSDVKHLIKEKGKLIHAGD